MASNEPGDVLGFDNIVGVGVGWKKIRGRPRPAMAIKVLVAKKAVPSRVSGGCLVPPVYDGYLTDVEEVGTSLHTLGWSCKDQHRQMRPAPCGVCIGPEDEPRSGTSGCWVLRDGKVHLLTVEHILAPCDRRPRGDLRIAQPSIKERGSCTKRDILASLVESSSARYHPTKDKALADQPSSDWALAEALPDDVDPEILQVGPIGRIITIGGMGKHRRVVKSGGGSGRTFGRLGSFNNIGAIGYRDGVWILLEGYVFVERPGWLSPFAKEGDSGALAVTADNSRHPLGILVARTPRGDGYLIPLDSVLNSARARLIRRREEIPPYTGGLKPRQKV